ncbi:MAG: CotH kinase family protein, partial [Clostridia bacterium]|nr:CotH kinase family protein [Clostridia bacterium]
KEAYGSGTAYYPFFGEGELAVFDNLLLRTGGQDQKYTNLIDAYCARVVDDQMDLDIMNDLPVAVYVNGEYWGLYYIRDKIN